MRVASIQATTAAGSGHPTTCMSAADLVSALFFGVMRFDPSRPAHPANDRFILSKGHAAPLLYAAWAEAGALPVEKLARSLKPADDPAVTTYDVGLPPDAGAFHASVTVEPLTLPERPLGAPGAAGGGVVPSTLTDASFDGALVPAEFEARTRMK